MEAGLAYKGPIWGSEIYSHGEGELPARSKIVYKIWILYNSVFSQGDLPSWLPVRHNHLKGVLLLQLIDCCDLWPGDPACFGHNDGHFDRQIWITIAQLVHFNHCFWELHVFRTPYFLWLICNSECCMVLGVSSVDLKPCLGVGTVDTIQERCLAGRILASHIEVHHIVWLFDWLTGYDCHTSLLTATWQSERFGQGLSLSRHDHGQVDFSSSNEIEVRIVTITAIIIDKFKSEFLILLEVEICLNTLVKVWVEVIFDYLGSAYFEPIIVGVLGQLCNDTARVRKG